MTLVCKQILVLRESCILNFQNEGLSDIQTILIDDGLVYYFSSLLPSEPSTSPESQEKPSRVIVRIKDEGAKS